MQNRIKEKRKGKTVMIIAIIVIVLLGAGGAVGWSYLSKEQIEAKSLPLDNVDFSNLIDGTYVGEYEGGMYKWRECEVRVTVSAGKVSKIELLKHKENRPPEFTDLLFSKVIERQSLQVDAISGATLTSKAYLQSVENALTNAEKK